MSQNDKNKIIAHLGESMFVTEDNDNWYIYNRNAELVKQQDKKSAPNFYLALIAKWGYEEVVADSKA